MLYIIGLGLNDEKDLSLKAVEALKACDDIYVEFYTNKWHGDINALEKIVKKSIEVLPREKVESEFLIKLAKNNNIALLVSGDPLSATTHLELVQMAKLEGIGVSVIHSSSVYTAVAESGLQLYKFGRTTTLCYPEPGFEPDSPYDTIVENRKIGLHSLILLDVKTDRWMTVKEGLNILLDLENKKNGLILSLTTKVIACCKLGGKDQKIIYDSVENIIKMDPKEVPACTIVPGKLNFKEEEFLERLT
ncbi:MAG: diphthine synthase [Candidatus Aenigmatarchaeota archaeon]